MTAPFWLWYAYTRELVTAVPQHTRNEGKEKQPERAKKRDEFVLKQKWAVRPVAVRRAMLDFKPNIVHFCGHGDGEEGIAFEDDTGNTKLVNAETLAEFFELFRGMKR